MLKKRKIITVLIMILLFAFLCIIYFVNSFNVNLKGGKLLIYSSIKLSQEDIFHINTNRYDILDHSSYFDDIWEIRKNSDGSYGYLFELDYHFDLSRYIKMNDYIVEATIDYSNLDDSEKIFFSESSGGLHDQYVFKCNGDGYSAPMFVSFMGCTYGKDEQEIMNIAKKLKITLWVQNKNGKVKEKKINISKLAIDVQEPSESDIESSVGLLGLNDR